MVSPPSPACCLGVVWEILLLYGARFFFADLYDFSCVFRLNLFLKVCIMVGCHISMFRPWSFCFHVIWPLLNVYFFYNLTWTLYRLHSEIWMCEWMCRAHGVSLILCSCLKECPINNVVTSLATMSNHILRIVSSWSTTVKTLLPNILRGLVCF